MRKIVGAFLEMSALPDLGHARRATSTHINSHASNAHPLLHDLQPNDKLHPPPRMQLATSNPKQHGEIAIRPRRLPLMDHNVLDILILGLGSQSALALAAAQSFENVARFLVAADFGEPARAFREEPADREED